MEVLHNSLFVYSYVCMFFVINLRVSLFHYLHGLVSAHLHHHGLCGVHAYGVGACREPYALEQLSAHGVEIHCLACYFVCGNDGDAAVAHRHLGLRVRLCGQSVDACGVFGIIFKREIAEILSLHCHYAARHERLRVLVIECGHAH